FIRELAENKNVGGGPAESFVRLINSTNLVTPLDASPTTNLAMGSDAIFRFLLHMQLYILPDVDLFDWTNFVAEGFNISGRQMLLSVIVLLGYLGPCALLAYYLMKSREVAA